MRDALHIVCPDCDAVNPVPQACLGEGATCGRCHVPLFQSRPLELSGTRFSLHVAHSEVPLLVDFWAPWCGPCRMMAPMFERAAALLEPGVRLVKVNTEQHPEVGRRLGIRAIPTMALFRNGREVARTSGALAAANIVAWTRQNL